MPEVRPPYRRPLTLPQGLVWVVLAVSVLPGIAMLLGVDSKSPTPPSGEPLGAFSRLSGAFVHTLLEWSAFCAALFTAILAFAQFSIRRDVVTPVVGSALFASGVVDAFHTLAADRLIGSVADETALIPFTWAISRLFNAVVCLAGVSLILWSRRKNLVEGSGRYFAASAIAFSLAAYLTILYCTHSETLPQTMFPGTAVTRPWDLYPFLLFVVTAFALQRLNQRFPSIFTHALLISTIPDLATQGYMAFGSSSLFDSAFHIAHFTKLVAYLVPFAGLTLDYLETAKEQQAAVELLQEQALELERANADAESARQRAIDAANAKSQFLATMSHEIRTPMNGVIATAELLATTAENEEQRHLIATIDSSGRTLLGIINDILDFSKLEAGRVVLEIAPTHLRTLTEEVARTLQPLLEGKGLEMRITIGANIPEFVAADPLRLRQVLLNLTSNAVKFTERGDISVRIEWDESGPAPLLHFEVEDTGIGIEHPEELFREFVQADATTTRRFGGTGLGLAISQRLVRCMGSELHVRSTPGQGSRFWFKIPATRVEGVLHTDTLHDLAVPTSGHALVVDDNEVNRMIARKVLERESWTVQVATDGEEALRMAGSCSYDIVFMDCQMPRLDGYTATAQLRQLNAPYCDVPVIAMTANALPEDRDRCLDSGMDDYLAKPVRQDGVRRMLAKWGHKTSASSKGVQARQVG